MAARAFPTIKEVRSYVIGGVGIGGDYHNVKGGHWLVDTPISTPMSGWEKYKASRTSWGINVLGSIFIEIEATDGTVGFATGFGGPPACWLVHQHFERFLIGADPRDTTTIFEQMYRGSMYYGRKGLPLTAISVIDLALWDLVGKLRNEPVYKMIGGSTRKSIDFYCTGPEPAHAKKNGFWGGKVPLPFCPEEGAEGLRKNVEFLRRHRESVGPEFPLMVDCYMSLNVSYTIDLVKACNDLGLNINWWEECLSPDDSAGFELIKRAHPQVKFTTGEHEYSRYGFRELIQSRNLDIIQPDVMWCGGLTELLKIANMAAAYDIPVVPHASGAYSYHYAAAQSKAVVPFCEYLANSPDGKSVMPVFGDLYLNEAMPINGKMVMSTLDKPGFGLELNPKANLINARMLLMPNPERPLGGGTSAGSASPIPKATSGQSTIPIPSASPAAIIPSAAANAAFFLSEKAANVASTLTEAIKEEVPEVAAAKTESALKQGQVPATANKERRQSAMDPEQARDDTKATIDVLRMRDAAQ